MPVSALLTCECAMKNNHCGMGEMQCTGLTEQWAKQGAEEKTVKKKLIGKYVRIVIIK